MEVAATGLPARDEYGVPGVKESRWSPSSLWWALPRPPPRITGTALVSRRMTTGPGTWSQGTTLRYQWLR